MKLKIVRICVLISLVITSISILGILIMWIVNFSMLSKYNSDDTKKDEMFFYQQKIDGYTFKLDSLIEINPLQAQLFADKLYEKYKKETIFLEYKVLALFEQHKYQEAIVFYKVIDTPYSEFNGTKMNNNRNIALCFENLKQFDSAIFYYKKSSQNDNLYKIAKCFDWKKEKDSALSYYSKVLEIMKNDENKMNYIKNIDFIDHLQQKVDSLKKNT